MLSAVHGACRRSAKPLGVAHKSRRARVFADADEDAFAGGPGPGDRIGLHVVEKLLVDALGGAPQRELAQRRQISRREIMLQRPLGLLGNIDLAFLQPLDEIVRRQVDQFDGVGAVEYRIRHGLAHPHMRDLRDHVVEAFDVLDVDGGIDIDAARQQLFDIEIALGVAAAGRIGMGEFIDQREPRPARDQRIEIHLLDDLILIGDAFAGDDLEPVQQRLGLGPPVGLDDADHDVDAGFLPGMRALQHFVGLADARGRADENLQPPGFAVLAPRRLQQGFRRRALFGVAAWLLHHGNNIVPAPRPA